MSTIILNKTSELSLYYQLTYNTIMVKDTIVRKSTEDLEQELHEIQDKIRAKKKAESEINLFQSLLPILL